MLYHILRSKTKVVPNGKQRETATGKGDLRPVFGQTNKGPTRPKTSQLHNWGPGPRAGEETHKGTTNYNFSGFLGIVKRPKDLPH